MVETKKNVVITGITGFLGSRVCLDFLLDGSFNVKGTVRDINNKERLVPIVKAYGEKLASELKIVSADLCDEESIDKAIEGANIVIHTASPFEM